MQKVSSLLFASLITISVVALASESVAQTTGAPLKAGTRLITLGTSGGPPPRAGRAQSSNLLTINGVHYRCCRRRRRPPTRKSTNQPPRYWRPFCHPSSRRSHGGSWHADV